LVEAILALEDGSVFRGFSFASNSECGGELVFNTAMTGYQEVITDPSYFGQIVIFTSPHIGNYGIHEDHSESSGVQPVGIIVREVCLDPMHPQSSESLPSFLERNSAFGITGVDTRALTLHVRERGNLRAWFTTRTKKPARAVGLARQLPLMREIAAVESVSTLQPYVLGPENSDKAPRLAVLDFGAKRNILRELVHRGCKLYVLPSSTPLEEIDRLRPDGVVLTNGPGDPAAMSESIPKIGCLLRTYPTLAICLGHQLVGMALGGEIEKLPYGHHGVNHPVKNMRTGRVDVTSQNHNYAISLDSLPAETQASFINLNDGTVQGLVHETMPIWSVQFHPEASPGPHEASELFDQFVTAVHSRREAQEYGRPWPDPASPRDQFGPQGAMGGLSND